LNEDCHDDAERGVTPSVKNYNFLDVPVEHLSLQKFLHAQEHLAHAVA